MFTKWMNSLSNKDLWIIGLGGFFGMMPLIVFSIATHRFLFEMTAQLFISISTLLYVFYTWKRIEIKERERQIKVEDEAKRLVEYEAESRRVAQQIEGKKEQEYQRQREPYANMNRMINCPICQGTGKAYFHSMECNVDGEYDHVMHRAISEDHYNKLLEEWGDGYAYAEKGVYIDGGHCPFCNNTGAVQARFEKSIDGYKECDRCKATGIIKKQVKLDVGIGYVDEKCSKCNGTGKLANYGKVYVQTALKAQQNDTHRYAVGGGYNFVFDLKNKDGSTDESCFMVNLDDQNKDFYSVSKPIDDRGDK